MIIAVPESYRDYLHNRVVRSVVDHVLPQKENRLPVDLEWPDIRAYHEAGLAARKVKVDYGLFVMELWDAVWKPVLEKYDINDELAWPLIEMDESERPSLDNFWDNGLFVKNFTLRRGGGQVHLYPQSCVAEREVSILISAQTGGWESLSAELNLNELWAEEADEFGNRQTVSGLVEIAADSRHLDVSALVDLADEALSKLLP
ncbi:MAG: hypothetical protein R3E95_07785 [Thiolinea sp.]